MKRIQKGLKEQKGCLALAQQWESFEKVVVGDLLIRSVNLLLVEHRILTLLIPRSFTSIIDYRIDSILQATLTHYGNEALRPMINSEPLQRGLTVIIIVNHVDERFWTINKYCIICGCKNTASFNNTVHLHPECNRK